MNSKNTTLSIVVFLLCIAGGLRAQAATYYVDVDSIGGACSDGAAGTNIASPWCTVQKAASTSVAGDVVNIRGGLYRERVSVANSGTSGNPITFQSYGTEKPVISGAILGSGFASLGVAEINSGILTESFEGNDDTFAAFTSTNIDSGNTLTVESDSANNGTYAMKATFGGTNRNARIAETITATPDVYQRMYFRVASGSSITVADTGQIIMNQRIDSAISRASVELLRNSSGQFYIRGRATNPANNSNVIFASTTPGSILPDTWYNIELRYKGGDAATGGAEIWLDTVSLGNSGYNWNTATTSIGRLEWGGGTSGTGVPSSGSAFHIDDIKASTTPIGAFTAAGAATTYQMTGVSGDPVFIYENDESLATSSALLYNNLSAGSFYYDSGNTTLYLRTTDSSAPSTKTIDIPSRLQALIISGQNYIVLDGLTTKYARGSGGLHGGFVLATSTFITVQNSTSTDHNGAGVYLHNVASSTIDNNQLLYNHREFGGGVRFEYGSDNNTISDNTITGLGLDAGNGINFCGDDSCGYTGGDYNTISGNTLYNLRDSCVYLGSLSHYNTYENNTCGLTYRADGAGGTGYHVSRGSNYNIARNNIFYDIYGASVLIQSNTIDSVVYPVRGNSVLNNVIYNNSTSQVGNHGGVSVIDDTYDTVLRNNIIYQANDFSGIRVTGAAATSTDSDYNLYYSTKGTVAGMFHYGTTSGTYYSNLDTFRTAFPDQEVHSINVEPEFTDAADLDFTLTDDSPAIDAGETNADVLLDIAGTSRPQGVSYDMGIYERALAVVVTPSSSSGGGGGSTQYLKISDAVGSGTSVTIGGKILSGKNVVLGYAASAQGSTPRCSASGSGYIANIDSEKLYNDGDSYSLVITGLSPDVEYKIIVCAYLSSDVTKVKDSEQTTYTVGQTTTETSTETQDETVTTEGVPTITHTFTQNISYTNPTGNNSNEVMALQKFLHDVESEPLTVDGIFGADDVAAVKRFQQKYASEILSVWGLTEATGFVGLTTRLKMNSLQAGKTAICPVFTEYNGGTSGITYSPEIGRTQSLLRDMGLYAGPVHRTWDPGTRDAVKRFQETFKEVMLQPWNLTAGTGYKYKTTNKFLNYLVGCKTDVVELDGTGTFNF